MWSDLSISACFTLQFPIWTSYHTQLSGLSYQDYWLYLFISLQDTSNIQRMSFFTGKVYSVIFETINENMRLHLWYFLSKMSLSHSILLPLPPPPIYPPLSLTSFLLHLPVSLSSASPSSPLPLSSLFPFPVWPTCYSQYMYFIFSSLSLSLQPRKWWACRSLWRQSAMCISATTHHPIWKSPLCPKCDSRGYHTAPLRSTQRGNKGEFWAWIRAKWIQHVWEREGDYIWGVCVNVYECVST